MSSLSEGEQDLEPLDLPSGKEYTHQAHRFPGKFHPPLIKKILRDHPEHEVIADPMAGSGTVGVEGVANGKKVLSTDLDPLSNLMIRAKTNPISPEKLQNIGDSILKRASPFPSPESVSEDAAEIFLDRALDGTRYIPPMNTFHWFDPYTAVGFGKILNATAEELSGEIREARDAVHLALAASVRSISRADPQPVSGLEVTSVRKEQLKNGLTFDVESRVQQSFKKLAKGYDELRDEGQLGESKVFWGNAKNFDDIVGRSGISPSMVVTSPPYCNAIEYSRRHRLESEWLGLWDGDSLSDLREDRLKTSREYLGSSQPLKETLENIGNAAHPEAEETIRRIEKEEDQPRKANLLRKYFIDAEDWLNSIYNALPKDGLFVMTIGPSTSYGEKIDTPAFLTDMATQDIGFMKVHEQRYTYKNYKMQYPTDGETTEYEVLLKFKK